MKLATCYTVAFFGVQPKLIEVQVQFAPGLPAFTIVGLADKAVAESRERIRACLHGLGMDIPAVRLTVNLTPADLQKEGAHYDLPIALAILAVMNIIPKDELKNYIALGEITLDGRILSVPGVLPSALLSAEHEKGIICPKDRVEAESIIEYYSRYWMDIIGTRGFKGKKALSGRPMFDQFFDVADEEEVDIESDDNVQLDESALDQLEQ